MEINAKELAFHIQPSLRTMQFVIYCVVLRGVGVLQDGRAIAECIIWNGFNRSTKEDYLQIMMCRSIHNRRQ